MISVLRPRLLVGLHGGKRGLRIAPDKAHHSCDADISGVIAASAKVSKAVERGCLAGDIHRQPIKPLRLENLVLLNWCHSIRRSGDNGARDRSL